MIISSQRHIDHNIVAEKIAGEDYEVMLSPEIVIDGSFYQVVLDGHHSLAAAKAAGAEPEYWVADSMDHDAVGLIGDDNDPDDFLAAVHLGDNYYDVETGIDVW